MQNTNPLPTGLSQAWSNLPHPHPANQISQGCLYLTPIRSRYLNPLLFLYLMSFQFLCPLLFLYLMLFHSLFLYLMLFPCPRLNPYLFHYLPHHLYQSRYLYLFPYL